MLSKPKEDLIMSEKCEIVTIDREGQPVDINKSDLDPADVIWGVKSEKPAKKTRAAK
tara:strand:+ start:4959 stop:5129 length:171 start_codon:yes stop_codon:yes gene_type:complete